MTLKSNHTFHPPSMMSSHPQHVSPPSTRGFTPRLCPQNLSPNRVNTPPPPPSTVSSSKRGTTQEVVHSIWEEIVHFFKKLVSFYLVILNNSEVQTMSRTKLGSPNLTPGYCSIFSKEHFAPPTPPFHRKSYGTTFRFLR